MTPLDIIPLVLFVVFLVVLVTKIGPATKPRPASRLAERFIEQASFTPDLFALRELALLGVKENLWTFTDEHAYLNDEEKAWWMSHRLLADYHEMTEATARLDKIASRVESSRRAYKSQSDRFAMGIYTQLGKMDTDDAEWFQKRHPEEARKITNEAYKKYSDKPKRIPDLRTRSGHSYEVIRNAEGTFEHYEEVADGGEYW